MIAVSAAMRDDVLRCYPDARPGPGPRRPQRHRHRRLGAGRRPRPGPRARRRPRPAERRVRRPDHPAEGAAAVPAGVRRAAARRADRAVRRRARHPRDRGRGRGPGRRRSPRSRTGVVWIREMLPRPRRGGAADRGDGVRLPVDLRAARHRQPRGDGLRDRGRRDRDRRHPRGRRRRRDRAAGADRAGRRRHRDAARPGRLRRRVRRRPDRRWSPIPTGRRRWAAPAASGPSTPSAGRRSPSAPCAVYDEVRRGR